MSLLKVELKEEANNYARGGAMIVVGGRDRGDRLCLTERGAGVWCSHAAFQTID